MFGSYKNVWIQVLLRNIVSPGNETTKNIDFEDVDDDFEDILDVFGACISHVYRWSYKHRFV